LSKFKQTLLYWLLPALQLLIIYKNLGVYIAVTELTIMKMENKPFIDFHLLEDIMLQFSIEDFRKYQTLIELFLKTELNNQQKKFDESGILDKIDQAKRENNHDLVDYYEMVLDSKSEEYWDIKKHFPHNFRSAFLIQIFSFIEHKLKSICDQHHFRSNSDFKMKELKGSSDLDKAKLYLKKSCKVNFERLEPEWAFINLIRKIRNRLVHHQGIIYKTDNEYIEIKNYVEKNNFLEFKNNMEMNRDEIIITTEELNEKLLNVVELFFKKLLTELKVNKQKLIS